jgi:hypothetical protein
MYLSRLITNSMFHSYDTQNKSFLFITSHNTKLLEQKIAYKGVLIYNKLFHAIKSLQCIMKLRKKVINFLLDKSFYSVEEFVITDY